jgi:o-succinylbenzoate synthase
VREGALLTLVGDSGIEGYGEATPIAGFGLESVADCREALESLASRFVGRELGLIEACLTDAAPVAPDAPVARAALDCALHDIVAKARALPLARLLHTSSDEDLPAAVPVNALVSGDTPAEVAASGRAAQEAGHHTLKLKVAAGSLEDDEARVSALRRAVGAELRLRLDANGGWSEKRAREALDRLAPFDIELLEQPVAASDLDALARLREQSKIALAADESAVDEADALEVVARRAADVVVIKPSAVGGLAAAGRVATAARSADMGVVVTSLLDGAIAVAAALHFAASISPGEPEPRACGLATGNLFERDLAQLPLLRAGLLPLPAGPGLGVAPDPNALAALACGPVREIRG